MKSQDEEKIIAKFKRHGHLVNRKSLQRTLQWLNQNPSNSLDTLIKKLDHLALGNNNHQQNLQHALQILSLKQKNLHSYEDLLQDTRKRCVYAISPYEYNLDTFFAERPEKQLFEFKPDHRLQIAQKQFKRMMQHNKDIAKDVMVGVLYESFNNLGNSSGPRLMLQNEVNQIQLQFKQKFKPNCLLLSGCIYQVKGKPSEKELTLVVESIDLLQAPSEDKQSMLKQKFKAMCQNISSGKQGLGFSVQDFTKYDCVYMPSNEPIKPTLVFGGITINSRTVTRLQRLVQAYPRGVACLILLLSGQDQQQIDLGLYLNCKIFLVPHITAPGPHLLPKLPLLDRHISGVKVLTNPARISLEGRELLFVNYPLIRNIYSNLLMSEETSQIPQEQLTASVASLMFSQGNVALTQHYYWPQAQYFNINTETTVFISDTVASMGFNQIKNKGGMATTGNFDLDGDFLCLMTQAKKLVQFCEQPSE